MITIIEKKLNYKQQRDIEIAKYNLLIEKLRKELQALKYELLDAEYTTYCKSYSIDLSKKYKNEKNLSMLIDHEIIVLSDSEITSSFSIYIKSGEKMIIGSQGRLTGFCESVNDLVAKELKLANIGFSPTWVFLSEDTFDFTDSTLKTEIFTIARKLPQVVKKIQNLLLSSRRKRV